MKRYVYKPTVKKIEKHFPYSAEVPKGYRTKLVELCRRRWGKCYYRWAPRWNSRMINGGRFVSYDYKWAVEETAVWQYEDGRLYVKEEAGLGMVMMAMLAKEKRKR